MIEAASDEVAVLYFGRLVELGKADQVFASPRHPYTKLLADSAPVVGRPLLKKRVATELPDAFNALLGCAFAARCIEAQGDCKMSSPPLNAIEQKHWAACFYPLS